MENNNHLNEQLVDTLVAFKFLKLMTQDFKDTDAFKLGIIDKDGKVLKKRKDLKSGAEKTAYTIFHTLVWNIKKLLNKVPGLRSKIGSYISSLYLLKEAVNEKYSLEDADKTIELILNHLIENGMQSDINIIFEGQFNDRLEGGSYVTTREIISPLHSVICVGDNITIEENTSAFTHFLGIPLYKGIHEDTGEQVIVDSSSISTPEMVAGMAVFDVEDIPHDMMYGHKTYERWNKEKFGSLDDDLKSSMKKWSYKNKGKDVAVRDKYGLITKFKNGRNNK